MGMKSFQEGHRACLGENSEKRQNFYLPNGSLEFVYIATANRIVCDIAFKVKKTDLTGLVYEKKAFLWVKFDFGRDCTLLSCCTDAISSSLW